MTGLETITEQVKTFCTGLVEKSLYLGSFDPESCLVVDDGVPEGGVFVNATFQLQTDFEDWANPPTGPDLVESARKSLKGRLQYWTDSKERTWKLEDNGDGTVTLAFYYLPRIGIEEYGQAALKVWKNRESSDYAYSNYEDEVIRIRYDGTYLETMRMENHNPTTYIKFDGKGELGECIRHHGEHCYLVKHLLKLAYGDADV